MKCTHELTKDNHGFLYKTVDSLCDARVFTIGDLDKSIESYW